MEELLLIYWQEILTALGIVLSMPLVSHGARGIVRLILLSAPAIVRVIILLVDKIRRTKSHKKSKQDNSKKNPSKKPQKENS